MTRNAELVLRAVSNGLTTPTPPAAAAAAPPPPPRPRLWGMPLGNDDDDRWALFLDRPLLMMFNNQIDAYQLILIDDIVILSVDVAVLDFD